MIMSATFSRQLRGILTGGIAVSAFFAAVLAMVLPPSPARAQTVVVRVSGDPITDLDLESRVKLDFLSTHKQSSREEVLKELIDEKLKIKEAKKFGVDPSSADIDQSYAAMSGRMRITPEQLTKSLEGQGVRPDTLRSRIKADMVWTSLVRGRYKESLQVGEKDVAAAVQVSGDEKQPAVESFEYHMQPIVLIVPRGSAPAVLEARHKEAEALRGRVQTCKEADRKSVV